MSRRHRFTPLLAAGAFAAVLGLGSTAAADARFGDVVAVQPLSALRTLADIDGDGDEDVLAQSVVDTDVSTVWLENGGTANGWTRHTISAHDTNQIATADLDGDGDLDVLSTGGGSRWFENLGAGATWVEHALPQLNSVVPVHVADVDGDGDPDIVGTFSLGPQVAWLENEGAGGDFGWTVHTIHDDAVSQSIIGAADVDGDGDLDVMRFARGPGVMAWHENDGDGGGWTTHTIDTRPYEAALADMDGDGDADVVTGVLTNAYWYENDGAGAGWTARDLGGAAFYVTPVDIDGDGDMDVIGTPSSHEIVTFENNGGGTAFTTHAIAFTSDALRPVRLAVSDVDGDGDADLLTEGVYGSTQLYLNLANHRTACVSAGSQTVATAIGSYAVTTADLDRDGDLDVISADAYANSVDWHESDGAGGYTRHAIAAGFNGAATVVAVDLDGDGDLDVVGTAAGSLYSLWFENDGSASGWATHTIGSAAVTVYLAAADLDRDGDPDVVIAPSSGGVRYYENGGSGAGWTTHVISPSGERIAIGVTDVDGDGDPDVLAGGVAPAWFENQGGSWTEHALGDAAGLVTSVVGADIDRDGDRDVLVALPADHVVAWQENTGATGWTRHLIDTVALTNPLTVLAVDLDGDGDLEVLSGSGGLTPRLAWHETDGAGIWTTHTIAEGGGVFRGLTAADLDRDGDPDVVVARTGPGSIERFMNGSGHLTLDVTSTAPAVLAVGTRAPFLSIRAQSGGRDGEDAVGLVGLRLRFESGAGVPLTTAQANALISTVDLDRTSHATGLTASGGTVVSTGPLLLDPAGEMAVEVPPIDAARIGTRRPVLFEVVPRLTPVAALQVPNAFRIAWVGEGVDLVDADHGGALRLACPSEVTSSPTTAVGPPEQITNGSFEAGTGPWFITNPRASARDCTTAALGSCSLRIQPAAGRHAPVRQLLGLSGPAGRALQLGASSRAESATASGEYAVWVVFEHADGSRFESRALPFARGTHGWQALSAAVTPPRAYRRVWVELRYAGATGRVWFDAISLKR